MDSVLYRDRDRYKYDINACETMIKCTILLLFIEIAYEINRSLNIGKITASTTACNAPLLTVMPLP